MYTDRHTLFSFTLEKKNVVLIKTSLLIIVTFFTLFGNFKIFLDVKYFILEGNTFQTDS